MFMVLYVDGWLINSVRNAWNEMFLEALGLTPQQGKGYVHRIQEMVILPIKTAGCIGAIKKPCMESPKIYLQCTTKPVSKKKIASYWNCSKKVQI